MSNKGIFLLAFYSAKPKDPAKTKVAGYMTDPANFDYDESINITRGIKTRDHQNAQVILNLSTQTVIKNTFNSNKDFATLLGHYQEGYPNYINPLLAKLYKDILDDSGNVHSQEKESS
jgi:hypothetical protein